MLVTFILTSALVTVLETVPTLRDVGSGACTLCGMERELERVGEMDEITIEVMYVSVWRLQHAPLAMILTVFSTLLYGHFPVLNTEALTPSADTSLSMAPETRSLIPSSTPTAIACSSPSSPPLATPCSFLGGLITLPILLFGLLLVTLLSFVLGREFSYVREISADK
ncbi:hypothetical protein H0H87_009416 [Tephrocybe sp. NHM501043]|nr:hypothetical protein H0H87_009416 [Tephrocybe sp. NHM501043]